MIKQKIILLILLGLQYCSSIYAYDFMVNGLYYNKLSSSEVEVTYKTKIDYSYESDVAGDVIIPSIVSYLGTEYTVTSLGTHAFSKAKNLTSIVIPNTVVKIGAGCFWECFNLKEIEIPSSVSSISNAAFAYCRSIRTLQLPDNLKIIDQNLFYGCWNLEFIEISDKITSIGNDAFNQCSRLSLVKSKITTPFAITDRTFKGIDSQAILQVPKNTRSLYLAYSGWTTNFYAIVEDSETDICNLSISASGNGSVIYNETTIRDKTEMFTLVEGTSATISFTPDNGYSIKSVKLNNIDVTSSVTNNSYTISNISANTTLEVEFEAIPPTAYTLSIKATGNGSASYDGTTIRSKTSSFTVNEGTSATISFTPDNGYRIKSVKLNNVDVTSSVTNNQYIISSISANTTMEVEFEAIPPTTYTLSITASGNGSASYSGSVIRGTTQTFTVNEGTSATVSFTPDSGYRIASVKLNNTDVTANVSNNQYTISSISANTTLSVTFEAIPATTYSLSITASGNGSASYSGSTIRSTTQSFTVNEGTSATVSFTPDSGYRIASVKLNNTDVTSGVSNNQYTISSISANTTFSVTFEAIPPTTYTLSITASGNGSASYSGTTIRSKTSTFTVNEGTAAAISFTPDNGYRIKSVRLNNADVTSSVTNNSYTISSISANTTMEVEFEAIPPTTYTLSITASGNGSAEYSGTTVRNNTSTFTLNAGVSATISLSPDSGHKIKSLKVNNTNVTSSISNSSYTVDNIGGNTSVEVEFEAITYSLSISSSGNGSANYGDHVVRNQTRAFTVEEGNDATITFSPDNGNRVSSVIADNQDVTSNVTGNRYTISNVKADVTLEVSFEEDINAITTDGLNFTVTSQSERTVILAGGDYGQVLTVPSSVTANNKTWQVTGIDNDALKDNAELAAIVWNPEVAFTANVTNPNLLLYVMGEQYAPSTIKNVVVNGTANSITLVDAGSGNSFFCPQAFTARSISYQHHYNMTTGKGTSQGWETIALPFDVQSYTHSSKGDIVPFANWRNGDATRPFWLYEMTGTGFVESGAIKAYTPYIISMPNNSGYDDEWILRGTVTFSASNVTIQKTEDLHSVQYGDRTFVPSFSDKQANEGLYALNVNNDYITNSSGMVEGSKFVLNMRQIHPFEAYMTTSSNARYAIGVFEGMTTSIQTIDHGVCTISNDVYDLQGRRVMNPKKGLYIKNRKKVIIK